MNKKTKFTIMVAWILLSRSYDAYCTYQLTPDLSHEANPLVSILGMSWSTLLITLGLLSIYVIYAYYVSVFKPIDLLPKESGYSFSEFVAFTYLGRKDSWLAMFYKLPNNVNRFNQWMGHNMTSGLAFAGVVSTIMWLLINNTKFYKHIHSVVLIYSILIIGCSVIIYNWNKIKYRKYLIETNQYT